MGGLSLVQNILTSAKPSAEPLRPGEMFPKLGSMMAQLLLVLSLSLPRSQERKGGIKSKWASIIIKLGPPRTIAELGKREIATSREISGAEREGVGKEGTLKKVTNESSGAKKEA